jgi:hypothetical protein
VCREARVDGVRPARGRRSAIERRRRGRFGAAFHRTNDFGVRARRGLFAARRGAGAARLCFPRRRRHDLTNGRNNGGESLVERARRGIQREERCDRDRGERRGTPGSPSRAALRRLRGPTLLQRLDVGLDNARSGVDSRHRLPFVIALD